MSLLNIDAENLKTEMDGGKSLLTIANERGVSEQSLKELMQNEMEQRLDQAVKAGKIPSDKAEQIKTAMANRIDDMIHGKIPMPKHPRGPQPQQ